MKADAAIPDQGLPLRHFAFNISPQAFRARNRWLQLHLTEFRYKFIALRDLMVHLSKPRSDFGRQLWRGEQCVPYAEVRILEALLHKRRHIRKRTKPGLRCNRKWLQ